MAYSCITGKRICDACGMCMNDDAEVYEFYCYGCDHTWRDTREDSECPECGEWFDGQLV